MARLIEESNVIEIAEKCTFTDESERRRFLDFVRYCVKETDTAYDIDKVVDELKQQSEQYRQRGFEAESKGFSTMADKYYGKQCSYEYAIEIVKQGVVSDDVCEWRLCDEEANVYDTSCRNPHILINGTPEENNYKFCPYCGKKIKVVK